MIIIIIVTNICIAVQVAERRCGCIVDLSTWRSQSFHRRVGLLLDDIRELREDFQRAEPGCTPAGWKHLLRDVQGHSPGNGAARLVWRRIPQVHGYSDRNEAI